jgi:hypothetical protein
VSSNLKQTWAVVLLALCWAGATPDVGGQEPKDDDQAAYKRYVEEQRAYERDRRWGDLIRILVLAVVCVAVWYGVHRMRRDYAASNESHKAYLERDAAQTERIVQLLEAIERQLRERGG